MRCRTSRWACGARQGQVHDEDGPISESERMLLLHHAWGKEHEGLCGTVRVVDKVRRRDTGSMEFK